MARAGADGAGGVLSIWVDYGSDFRDLYPRGMIGRGRGRIMESRLFGAGCPIEYAIAHGRRSVSSLEDRRDFTNAFVYLQHFESNGNVIRGASTRGMTSIAISL